MEWAQFIAAVLGGLVSLTALITFCTKKGRNIINCLFIKKTKDLREVNNSQTEQIKSMTIQIQSILTILKEMTNQIDNVIESSKQQCRNVIKVIYYKYCDSKKIPLYERKTADSIYTIYCEKFNGNGYIKLLYSEICKWEIINTGRLLIEDED